MSKLNYNYITNRTSPNHSKGRGAQGLKFIDIHWWGDPKQNPTAEGVVNWLCNSNSQVSAHLVVTGTGRRVWQLVNDKDTAWSMGNFTANQQGISLELDPRCRNEDYDVAAEVISNLWKAYGKLPLRPHKSVVATQCPGNYDLSRLRTLAEQKFTGATPAPSPAPVKEKSRKDIKEDFVFNKDTRLYKILSNQVLPNSRIYKKGEKIFIQEELTLTNNSKYYRTKYSASNEVGNGFRAGDLDKVKKPVVTKKTETLKVRDKYETILKDDSSIKKGETKVQQKGIDGVIEQVVEITLTDGKETGRKMISEKQTVAPVDEIILVGTKEPSEYPNWFIDFWMKLIGSIKDILGGK